MQIVEGVLAIAAGWLLFALWARYVRPHELGRIVSVGLALRAIAGQALFWVSYLRIPVAVHLQSGNGLWFFAQDARLYMQLAESAASGGLVTLVTYSRAASSVSYVQAMALCFLLFGRLATSALLLNLFAYLGSCLLVLRMSASWGQDRSMTRVSLVAISFSPAAILWSTQPLKDTLLQFLIVVTLAGARSWQRACATLSLSSLATSALVLWLAVFTIAGIRWYFAFALLLALGLFAPLAALSAPRRIVAGGTAVVLLALLSRAVLAGAGPYLPPRLELWLSAGTASSSRADRPLSAELAAARDGFDRAGGATVIAAPSGWVPDAQSLSAGTPASSLDSAAGGAGFRVLPTSHFQRLALGVEALIVPQFLARPLGLMDVRGGQGMLWFADLDTIAFDLLLAATAVAIWRRFRAASFRNAPFWMLAATVALVAVPLAYTVSNFGTLFRLRGMVYTAVALLPLALAEGQESVRRTPAAGDVVAEALDAP